ncbi:MAG: SH3 domain-containing protein [Anaerolineae bacterium]|nr:SH3 domain-containing protein [Anaerolineae bacterium]
MKWSRHLLIWLTVLALLMSFTSFALASSESPENSTDPVLQTPNTLVRANGNVRLRAEPSLDSERVALIGWGDIAVLLAVTEDGEWYQLNFNNIIGWAVSEWFTLVSGEIEPLVDVTPATNAEGTPIPVQPAAVTAPGAAPATGLVRSLDNVRIRQEPNIRSPRIGFIGWGELAELLAVSADGVWYQVDYDGVIGWSVAELFEVVGSDNPTIITQPNNVVLDSPLSIPPVGNASGLVTSQANVRIRAEPSLQGRRISFIGWGEQAEIVGINEDRTWYQINYNGIVGWSLAEFFVVEGDITTAPVTVQVTPGVVTATPVPGATPETVTSVDQVFGVVRSLGNLRLRDAPALNARQIGRLGWGDEANLLAVSDDRFWYQVEFEGVIGWAIADYFELVRGQIPPR